MKRDNDSIGLYSDASSASASTVDFLDGLFDDSSCSSQESQDTRHHNYPRSLQRRSNSDPISFTHEIYQSTSNVVEGNRPPIHHAFIDPEAYHVRAFQHQLANQTSRTRTQTNFVIAGQADHTSVATHQRYVHQEKFKQHAIPRSFSEPDSLGATQLRSTNQSASLGGSEKSFHLRISQLLGSDKGAVPSSIQYAGSLGANYRRHDSSMFPSALFIPGLLPLTGNRFDPQNPFTTGNTAIDSETFLSSSDSERKFYAAQAASARLPPSNSDERNDEMEFPPQKNQLSLDPKKDGTTDVHPEDILLGRGRSLLTHPGNIRLRSIVDRHRELYGRLGNRDEKTALSKIVLRLAKQAGPNGHKPRFLKYHRDSNSWVVVADAEARNKISHLFRDKPRKVKSSPASMASKSIR